MVHALISFKMFGLVFERPPPLEFPIILLEFSLLCRLSWGMSGGRLHDELKEHMHMRLPCLGINIFWIYMEGYWEFQKEGESQKTEHSDRN